MDTDRNYQIPDPHSRIASIRAKLPKKSRVKKSPYCDHIIALRLKGTSFKKISEWLLDRGEEFYISAWTISQTFQKVQTEYNIPFAEELAERYGGEVDFEAAHELKRLALVQRTRIDRLTRQEDMQAQRDPKFHNQKIKYEIDTMVNILKQFQNLMKDPMTAATENAEAQAVTDFVNNEKVNEELGEALIESIRTGNLTEDTLGKLLSAF